MVNHDSNNIKLNTAAKISEIKLLISSCERVGSIRFDAQNKIKFYRNEPNVVLTDYVRHPNTVRAPEWKLLPKSSKLSRSQ